mgnify:CR=1 FL=1
MTKVVHKWTLPEGPGSDVHRMPREHKFVGMCTRVGGIDLWFEVDDEHAQADTLFQTIGTGTEIPQAHSHVTTYKVGIFVWHVYKRDAP